MEIGSFAIIVSPESVVRFDAELGEYLSSLFRRFVNSCENPIPLWSATMPRSLSGRQARVCVDCLKREILITDDDRTHNEFMNRRAPSVFDWKEFKIPR
ncbi:MAG TPA: hypothetical protein PLH22_02055 [Candidatus Colwellbacteria bacterium]|nr:hypothetical protein [Candidatus Colwellbacteria bacterium]